MGKKKPPWDSDAWMKDRGVRSLSFAARGLWKDMLCLMDNNGRRGYLSSATGCPLTLDDICQETGGSTDEVTRLIQELDYSGVYSKTPQGVIYNRRMVREERKRQLCSEAGRKGGGNPNVRAGPLKVTYKGRVKGGFKGQAQSQATPQVTSGVSTPPVRSLSLSLLDPDVTDLVEERESVGDRGVGEGANAGTFKGAGENGQRQHLAPPFKGQATEFDNHPAVAAWCEAFGEMPDLFQREAIAKSVSNYEVWKRTLDRWKLNRYGVRVGNVLDSYQANLTRQEQAGPSRQKTSKEQADEFIRKYPDGVIRR